LLYAAAVLATTVAAWVIADDLPRDDLRGRAAEHLLLARDHVVAMVDRYRYLPAVVAKDERIRQLLAAPEDRALVAAANQYLEMVNGLAGSDVLYLLDPTGTCLASSNWRERDSFVGRRYDFRPYLKKAIEQGSGSDYAKGFTTGKYGYFIASRIGTAGEPAGVAVGKIDLSSLAKAWTAASDRVALVDSAGMIFLSGVQEWRLTPLYPLSADDRARIQHDRQYDQESIDRPPLLPTRPRPGEEFDLPIQGRNVPVKALDFGSDGWQILAAYETAGIPLWAGLVALAVFLAAVLVPTVGFYLRERGRRIKAGELRAILENMSVGIAVFDRALRLVAWNDKYRLLNRYPDDLVRAGRPLSEIIRHNIERGDFGAVDTEQELRKRLDQARESATQQLERRRPDGTWVEIRHSRMSDGRYIRVYGDITERKRTEAALAEHQTDLERLVGQRTAQLELANERLQVAAAQTEAEKRRVEQASRAKTTLLGAVNHDIRNPLNIILNAAKLVMRNATLPPQQYANLEKIDAKGRELLELVEDLLDYTRADRINIAQFRLPPIIERCRSAIELTIAAAGVEIISDVPPDLPVLAQDERKLRRIVINLMDNAAKFTETGTIRVSATRRDGTIEIAVADSGRGIAAGDIERIFDEGEQIGPGARQPTGGIGLGLAICRRFAGQMGGEIRVQSRLGEGSVFTLSLPIIHPTAGDDGLVVGRGASR